MKRRVKNITKKLPKNHLFCEGCWDKYGVIVDLGPPLSPEEEEEEEGDGFYCEHCHSLASDTTFDKILYRLDCRVKNVLEEKKEWLKIRKKWEEQ